jgi:hypothetical protein
MNSPIRDFELMPVSIDGPECGDYLVTGVYDPANHADPVEIHAVTGDNYLGGCGPGKPGEGEPIRLTIGLIEALEEAVNELLRDHRNDGADAKGDADFHAWQDEHEPGEVFRGRGR